MIELGLRVLHEEPELKLILITIFSVDEVAFGFHTLLSVVGPSGLSQLGNWNGVLLPCEIVYCELSG